MTLRQRFFAADSREILKALEGCRELFNSASHTPKDDDYSGYWELVGKSHGFNEEEVNEILQGTFDQVIIDLLFHPDRAVAEKARETVIMADHLVAQIQGKAPAAARGMSMEGKRSLVMFYMNRPRSLR